MGIANILYPPGATRLDPKVASALFLILVSKRIIIIVFIILILSIFLLLCTIKKEISSDLLFFGIF